MMLRSSQKRNNKLKDNELHRVKSKDGSHKMGNVFFVFISIDQC